jgi:hypothetical protein
MNPCPVVPDWYTRMRDERARANERAAAQREAGRQAADQFVRDVLSDLRAGRYESFADELGQSSLTTVIELAKRRH